jgi:hypothetical protein
MLGDVDGDGKADIVAFGDAGVYVARSTGTGFASPQLWYPDFGYDQGWRVDEHPRFVADVNGDHLADIVGFGDAGVYVSLSTGTGFSPPQLWITEFGYSQNWRVAQHPRFVRDIDGDGRADILGFGDAGVLLSLGTVTGFAPPRLVVSGFGYGGGWHGDDPVFAAPRVLADVNGDGRPDIVGYYPDGSVYVSTYVREPLPILDVAAAPSSPGAILVDGIPGFSAPQKWAWWDTFRGATDTRTLPPAEFLLTAADWDGDGSAGLVGFGPDGVHAIDLRIHMQ